MKLLQKKIKSSSSISRNFRGSISKTGEDSFITNSAECDVDEAKVKVKIFTNNQPYYSSQTLVDSNTKLIKESGSFSKEN